MKSSTPGARVVLSALLAFVPFIAPAVAQRDRSETPPDVEVLTGVEFGQGGGRALKLIIIRPKTPPNQPMPVVVYIHGGGWRSGSSQGGIARLTPFAQRGYLGASIEYRLSGEANFPAQIEDAKCAIRFLRAKAAEYNIDPDRIGAWGPSSGGHLAALLGTSSGAKSLEGTGGHEAFSSRVQAVADWFGPSDLALMLKTSSDGGVEAVSKMLGGSPTEIKERAIQVSPLTYVSKVAPPFLILHGDQDTTVPVAQSELLHAALKKAGVESTLHIVKGGGHNLRGPEYDKMADDFFDRHLQGGPSVTATPASAAQSIPAVEATISAATSGGEKVDLQRARSLFRKKNGGQTLSAEDEAYLERAMGGWKGGAKRAPSPKQDSGEKPLKPIVSKEACPTIDLSIAASDGQKTMALMRKPPGAGPFPAVVYFHGGSSTFSRDQLEVELQGQTLSRFLAAGYVVIAGTYRPIREIDKSIGDCVAIVEHIKTIAEVDPKSVVVWGDSGGGSLAFDIAATIPVCAITVHEPATILFARVGSGADRHASLTDPKSVYTSAAQSFTRAKIRKIDCPIFLPHGDVHLINKFNNEITVPEFKAEGRNLEVKLYPGENHGFSHRSVATLDGPKRFFEDTHAFFKRHLPTLPKELPTQLFKEVPVEFERGRSVDREEK